MRVVDAHLHLWELAPGRYSWLGPQHGPLHRSFTAEEAARELAGAGVDAAVLVQAEDSDADTAHLLGVADRHPWVLGVVGWVDLEHPGRAEEQLDRHAAHPAFCGVRQLVHDDPRDEILGLAGVRRSLRLLADRGLPWDLPDAWPRHLHQVAGLVDDVPGLTVVLDHLGKPPRGSAALDAWARELRELARRDGVVAKVSGLQVPGQPFTTAALRPVWDVALDAFGPGRLMYGSDWPMTVPAGGYQAHWGPVRALVDELSRDERAELLSGTAWRTYRRGLRPAQ